MTSIFFGYRHCCALLEHLLMATVMMHVELALMLELKVIRHGHEFE